MAKKDEVRSNKSKMTVMIFQLEGSDETLQEGLRKISAAAENIIRPPTRSLPALTRGNGAQAETNGNGENAEADLEETTIGDRTDEENADIGASESKRQKRVERSPEVVKFDVNKAKISMADYCSKKGAGESATRRFLVLGLWLKEQLGIAEFGVDHIYTCYKLIGWNDFPSAPGAAIRQLKATGNLERSGRGLYSVNHIGETEVNRIPAKS